MSVFFFFTCCAPPHRPPELLFWQRNERATVSIYNLEQCENDPAPYIHAKYMTQNITSRGHRNSVDVSRLTEAIDIFIFNRFFDTDGASHSLGSVTNATGLVPHSGSHSSLLRITRKLLLCFGWVVLNEWLTRSSSCSTLQHLPRERNKSKVI